LWFLEFESAVLDNYSIDVLFKIEERDKDRFHSYFSQQRREKVVQPVGRSGSERCAALACPGIVWWRGGEEADQLRGKRWFKG
jgi:hypothetical protein